MSETAVFAGELEIIQRAADWLDAGHDVLLVTVLATWGSSPRPIGSLMAVRADGTMHGSVSGGCIEDDLLGRLSDLFAAGALPRQLTYGAGDGVDVTRGLPCGGRLALFIERLEGAASLRSLLDRVSAGQLVARQVGFDNGEVTITGAATGSEFSFDGTTVQKVFGPQWHLLLIGAGDLARYVSRTALMLGYRVTVCDPREQFLAGFDEQGVTITTQMPDDACRALADHPRAAIVTLAHDPKVDDMALMAALGSQAFYIGALGSQRTSKSRRQRLATLDLSAAQISRLKAPVGLSIGSRTPAEIAVSIMAEITAARRVPEAQFEAHRSSRLRQSA